MVNQCSESPINPCLIQACGPDNNYQCEFVDKICNTTNDKCLVESYVFIQNIFLIIFNNSFLNYLEKKK